MWTFYQKCELGEIAYLDGYVYGKYILVHLNEICSISFVKQAKMILWQEINK